MNQLNQVSTHKLNIDEIRREFPSLSRIINGKQLAYLDNAASLLKPKVALEKQLEFDSLHYSNVHRSVHTLSQEATQAYEEARAKIKKFFGVNEGWEAVFTKGTTESVNLVCSSWGNDCISAGDRILVTRMEHHANFVPWQQLAKRKAAHLDIVELDSEYRLDLASFEAALKKGPKIVAFSAMSNVTGVINPVEDLARMAKKYSALVVVDAAQWVAHFPLELSVDWPHVDFVCLSSHKMGGPTGLGLLIGKVEILESMSPYQFGGDMILDVRDDETLFNELPLKFEAGTPAISGAVGFGFALDFLHQWKWDELSAHEAALTEYALAKLSELEGVQLLGPSVSEMRGPVFSFTFDKIHSHDLGSFLDSEAIAVRGGHHCAQPFHKHYSVSSSTRASFSFYNTFEEVDRLVEALRAAGRFFKR